MSVPAGWYPPDPSRPMDLQYWDGTSWTEWRSTVADTAASPAPTPAPSPAPIPVSLTQPFAPVAPVAPAAGAAAAGPTGDPFAVSGGTRPGDPFERPSAPVPARSNTRWIIGGVAAGLLALGGVAAAVASNAPTSTPDARPAAASSSAATSTPTPTRASPTPTKTTKTPTPTPTKTRPVVVKDWYPKGYTPYEDGLAFAWVPVSQLNCDAYTSCWGLKVFARDGCPSGLYIELAVSREAGGTILGSANDLVGGVPPGRTVLLKPATAAAQGEGGLYGEITALNCY